MLTQTDKQKVNRVLNKKYTKEVFVLLILKKKKIRWTGLDGQRQLVNSTVLNAIPLRRNVKYIYMCIFVEKKESQTMLKPVTTLVKTMVRHGKFCVSNSPVPLGHGSHWARQLWSPPWHTQCHVHCQYNNIHNNKKNVHDTIQEEKPDAQSWKDCEGTDLKQHSSCWYTYLTCSTN